MQQSGRAVERLLSVYDLGMEKDQAEDQFWMAPDDVRVCGAVRLQGSKSVAQRALLNAFLADGQSLISGIPDCEDLEVFIRALSQLGGSFEGHPPGDVTVTGCGAKWAEGSIDLDLGANGTAMRFLTAVCVLRPGKTRINGETHRPMGPLVESLEHLGAKITYLGEKGYLPLELEGAPVAGGKVVLQAALSSQFTSALMLLAPHTTHGLQIRMVGPISSRPYMDLTAAVLRAFGVKVKAGAREIQVASSTGLRSGKVSIEADASAAAFPLCAAAITGGEVSVEGVGTSSLQGDRMIADLLSEMGCTVQISENRVSVSGHARKPLARSLEGVPDLVPPLAIVAAFCRGESIFSGVSHLKVKESDRLEVLCQGMQKLGIRAEVQGDLFRIVGSDGSHLKPADLDPAGDHRMAMAFALLSLKVSQTRVLQPACVRKSDPEFFTRMEKLMMPHENTSGELSFE
ncbi:MAG: 3-phosphoshikimate 1-carboxyvinyltransferase [Planctomycetota bacterium]|nr:3-phosphoshikimate 1-carboxyvinyltransferase [Planctomycetota bacterium]MDG2084575.1 3-phosphoshikimate 1-carboxyvinyltransferase [Planctomycetota bacterium]